MTRPFTVNLRKDTSGGTPVVEPLGDRAAFSLRSRAILLVHGYNNSESEALESFNSFTAHIEELAPRLIADMGIVFWPGDWRVPLFRMAAYPWRVATALESADLLAGYLESLRDYQGRPTELVIVAHSLGCRFVLESVRGYLASGPDRRVTLILMAAAVPLPWVEKQEWLGQSGCLRTHILFSPADKVLHRAFPIGQRLAEPHFGLHQEAVGRFGGPPEQVWSRRQEMFGYDHGDYWEARSVARIVCLIVGRSVARELASREIPSSHLHEYEGTESREVSTRSIGRSPAR